MDDYVCTHAPIGDETFSNFDPTNHVYNSGAEAHDPDKWHIKGGYIAEVRLYEAMDGWMDGWMDERVGIWIMMHRMNVNSFKRLEPQSC